MKRVPRLMDESEILLYEVKTTMENVREHFVRYRNYKDKIKLIEGRLSSSLSDDNMGIFSSKISDPTGNKVEQAERYLNYIETMDANLEIIRKNLTSDEKTILNLSILQNMSDEYVAEYISVIRQNFYQRKKSCYIKVACYFNIDVERDI